MLAYRSNPLRLDPFASLLADEMDDDARRFYARMSDDIVAVAAAAQRVARPISVVHTLLSALVAVPAAKASCWRRLYRQIAALVTASEGASPTPELARLQSFLIENADLATSAGA